MRFFVTLLFFFPFLLLASDVSPEPTTTLLDLIKNWKEMTPLGIGMGLVSMLVQALKSDKLGGLFKNFKYKRTLIVILGQIYAIGLMVVQGSSWISAIITGLISSGGAVAIYEAIKPLFSRDKS